MDGAGATLGGVTADMSAGERQLIAYEIDKQRTWLDFAADRLAVDRHGNSAGHNSPPHGCLRPARSVAGNACRPGVVLEPCFAAGFKFGLSGAACQVCQPRPNSLASSRRSMAMKPPPEGAAGVADWVAVLAAVG